MGEIGYEATIEKFIENKDSIKFLFDISKEVKNFYETPVLFLTKKDYSDPVFDTMCEIRALLRGESKINNDVLINIIGEYHLNWLRIINEIESFKRNVKNISREEIFEAVSYTINCVGERLKYYQRYMIKYRSGLSNLEQIRLLSDMEIVEEMHGDIVNILSDSLVCLRSYLSDDEFHVKIYAAVEQLSSWVDKIHDSLTLLLCRYFNINLPSLTGDLAKVLQGIVDDLHKSSSISALTVISGMKTQGQLKNMIQCTASRNLEITKLMEKINVLNERISRAEHETTTAAVLALKNKKEYLEERLESLEKLKINLSSLSNLGVQFSDDLRDQMFPECGEACKDFYQIRIFNHLLPSEQRELLVTKLVEVWNIAVFGEIKMDKSIISILSATMIKEEFTDELGIFYIDEHGRKIYKKPDDATLYQCNERNELVPLSDDLEHIYFYDECGRYYHDHKTRQRVYKATDTASEYMMGSCGTLLKVKEERNGITYYYDNFGRYYIDENGKHIYREPDSLSEYENDGLGNLVRIRDHLHIFNPCPDDLNVTADFKYLEGVVGPALRKSIAKVILVQPVDPIKYLSSLLKKYRANMEFHERRMDELKLLEVERELIREEERAEAERRALEAALLAQQVGSEASYDSNLLNYSKYSNDY